LNKFQNFSTKYCFKILSLLGFLPYFTSLEAKRKGRRLIVKSQNARPFCIHGHTANLANPAAPVSPKVPVTIPFVALTISPGIHGPQSLAAVSTVYCPSAASATIKIVPGAPANGSIKETLGFGPTSSRLLHPPGIVPSQVTAQIYSTLSGAGVATAVPLVTASTVPLLASIA
jgi:hypothetical protein